MTKKKKNNARSKRAGSKARPDRPIFSKVSLSRRYFAFDARQKRERFADTAAGQNDMKRKTEEPVQNRRASFDLDGGQPLTNEEDHRAGDKADEEFLVEIYVLLGPFVRRALLKRGHRATKGEVEELQHEIFSELIADDCRRLRLFDSTRGSLKTWLATVVERLVIDQFRRRHQETSLDEVDATGNVFEPVQEVFHAEDEKITALRRALAELSEGDRRFFKLCCDDTLSEKAIASALGCPVERVRLLD